MDEVQQLRCGDGRTIRQRNRGGWAAVYSAMLAVPRRFGNSRSTDRITLRRKQVAPREVGLFAHAHTARSLFAGSLFSLPDLVRRAPLRWAEEGEELARSPPVKSLPSAMSRWTTPRGRAGIRRRRSNNHPVTRANAFPALPRSPFAPPPPFFSSAERLATDPPRVVMASPDTAIVGSGFEITVRDKAHKVYLRFGDLSRRCSPRHLIPKKQLASAVDWDRRIMYVVRDNTPASGGAGTCLGSWSYLLSVGSGGTSRSTWVT